MDQSSSANSLGSLPPTQFNHTISSARCGLAWPPPPRPLSALNMPGHMKHTNATIPSWNRGDAYQGVRQRPPPRSVHPSWRNLNITQRLIDDLSRLSRLSRHGALVGRRISVRRSISHDWGWFGDLGLKVARPVDSRWKKLSDRRSLGTNGSSPRRRPIYQ